jgi:outer membrane protein assembly factor BamB
MSKAARNSLWMSVAVWITACSALLGQEGPISTIDELLGRDLALLRQADERFASGAAGEGLDIFLPLVEEQGEKLVPRNAAPGPYQFSNYIMLREAFFRRLTNHANVTAELRQRRGSQVSSEGATPGRLHFGVLDRGTSDAWLARADELFRMGKLNDARDFLMSFAGIAFSFETGTREGRTLHGERLAEIQARLAYISLLEGSPKRAQRERESFHRNFGQAQVRIAGREEVFVEQFDRWKADFAKQLDLPVRLGETHFSFSIEPKGSPIWRRDLEAADAPVESTMSGVFPLSVHGHVFASTGDAIYCWGPNELNEGAGEWPAPLYRATTKADRAPAAVGVVRNGLSLSEDAVYGRLGSIVTRKRSSVPAGDQVSGVIVGLNASIGGALFAGFPLSPGLEEEFDGPPLVHEGKMLVAIRKRDETRTQLIVRCIDIASMRVIWQRSIVNAETRGRGNRDEASQTTLVLDGERLYVAPHLGCVVCLDAPSGGIRWLTKYPRSEFPTSDGQELDRWKRGLGAMHLRGDLLVVLAADCERVFALDGFSGELKWSSRRESMSDATYVLGSTEDDIVLMGESIYWLDAISGQVTSCYPERWVNGGQDRVDPHAAYGRGIWAGDSVWYPARHAILKVALALEDEARVTSELPLPPRSGPFGNLAYADGRLYWASNKLVLAWKAPSSSMPVKNPPRAKK